MRYDVASKRLVEIGKEAILRWLLDIDVESAELIEEIPRETISLRRSDFPLLVRDKEGNERVVLIEFQTRWEPKLPLRLLEYLVRFKLKYDLPVFPVVLLFKEHKGASGVYEDESIRFEFRLVKLWEIDGRELVEKGDVRLLPFVPLTRCGREEVLEADRRIYNSELERSIKSDLLTALAIFAGLKSGELMKELFERRRDIMIESPAYELIKREGLEEGIQRGIEIGIERGMLEDAKEMVLRAYRVRFGAVPRDIEEGISRMRSRATLASLLEVAITCKDPDEFREELKAALGEG